jgi:hypothetical protein
MNLTDTQPQPESPEIIALHIQQLAEGTRLVVAFANGQGVPAEWPARSSESLSALRIEIDRRIPCPPTSI